jgi:hypothetical protein
MTQGLPFSPLGASVTVVAPSGSSSASTTLPGTGGFAARVFNEAAVPITVRFAQVAGGATALATDLTIGAGLAEVVGIGFGTTDVAVYGIGGTGNVVIQRGEGL